MSSIKVIVMGVGGVGKSAITNRFVIGRWVEKYDPTIEESYQTTVDIDGKALQVEILVIFLLLLILACLSNFSSLIRINLFLLRFC
jgi:GTPase SAR1 family protein